MVGVLDQGYNMLRRGKGGTSHMEYNEEPRIGEKVTYVEFQEDDIDNSGLVVEIVKILLSVARIDRDEFVTRLPDILHSTQFVFHTLKSSFKEGSSCKLTVKTFNSQALSRVVLRRRLLISLKKIHVQMRRNSKVLVLRCFRNS